MSKAPTKTSINDQKQQSELQYKMRWFLDRDQMLNSGLPPGKRRHILATELAEWVNQHYQPKGANSDCAQRDRQRQRLDQPTKEPSLGPAG